MTDQTLLELQREFSAFKKSTTKELDLQSKKIHKLENDIKSIKSENSKFVVYVNNLMKKADNLITTRFNALRRTQVIDRQHATQLKQDVDRILRQK